MGKIHDTADFKYEKFNGCYRISTVGFLVQQYYNAVKKEVANEAKRMAKFKVYMAKYEIKMAQYKNFIDTHWGCDSAYDSLIKTLEKEKIPRTRSTILEYIFANWNVRSNKEQKNGLEKSLENIGKFTDADQGFYMPHPLDGMFVIDMMVIVVKSKCRGKAPKSSKNYFFRQETFFLAKKISKTGRQMLKFSTFFFDF